MNYINKKNLLEDAKWTFQNEIIWTIPSLIYQHNYKAGQINGVICDIVTSGIFQLSTMRQCFPFELKD